MKRNGGKRMDKSDKYFCMFLVVAFTLVFIAIFGIPYLMGLDDERVVVEGKIVDVFIERESEFVIQYNIITLTFDTGEEYMIREAVGTTGYFERVTDFTVNSKFIINFYRHTNSGYWEIEHIYKVPDKEEYKV